MFAANAVPAHRDFDTVAHRNFVAELEIISFVAFSSSIIIVAFLDVILDFLFTRYFQYYFGENISLNGQIDMPAAVLSNSSSSRPRIQAVLAIAGIAGIAATIYFACAKK